MMKLMSYLSTSLNEDYIVNGYGVEDILTEIDPAGKMLFSIRSLEDIVEASDWD
jgi:hypothetical protein